MFGRTILLSCVHRDVRLSQAASYLRTADMSIDAIAHRTGYGSNASLSKAFRREFGASPGAYRAGAAGGSGPSGARGHGVRGAPGAVLPPASKASSQVSAALTVNGAGPSLNGANGSSEKRPTGGSTCASLEPGPASG